MSSRATRLAADVLRVLPRKRISRAMGRLASAPWPAPVTRAAIAVYERAYGVELGDFVVPQGGFASLEAFFTRALRPGARPIDPDPRAIVSPADGTIADRGPIDERSTLLVKGRTYDVGALVGDPSLAPRYVGGWFVMVYLHPRDYHRVHAPVDGTVRRVRHVPGTLYPVNAIGEDHVADLFVQNERVVVLQDVAGVDVPVVTMMIGALGVGRIEIAFTDIVTNVGANGLVHDRTLDPPARLARGDEIGTFHMGSTAVVLVPPGLASPEGAGAGNHVLLGNRIGLWSAHAG
jgi:phosphatidylserine decarboxylase